MDQYLRAEADTLAGYIRQALSAEGGHLSMHSGGARLHYACGAYVSGFECETIKAACLAAGLPVIDGRKVPFGPLYALIVEAPRVAVGKPADARPWNSLSDAPLAHVAAVYRAAGAEVFNVPGVSGPGAEVVP